MIRALKVNGDYEVELFHGMAGPQVINQSLEFLAFYLSEDPVRTTKIYSAEYLDHVESVTGRRPVLVAKGPTRNWWGPLVDPEFERWMNSKLTSAELALKHGWTTGAILRCADDLPSPSPGYPLLVKDPYGMSGQGLRIASSPQDLEGLKSYPVVLEPLRDRVWDFSHYVFPDGTSIAYENVVDQRFQYRGTLFNDVANPTLEKLSFYQELDWTNFDEALGIIKAHYMIRSLFSGFSVDSFVYRDGEHLRIHNLCEVNYRRTVGSTAFELARRYSTNGPWCLFTLAKLDRPDFRTLKEKIASLRGVLLLSPADVRFQMFLLSAPNREEGKVLLRKLKELLPQAQLPVDIED